MLISDISNPISTMLPVRRGAFIVLEGVDRCGKTTQSALLLKKLVSLGIAAVAMRFPDRTTPVGQLINSYLASGSELDDHAVHLLFSANRWEAAPRLTNLLLDQKTTVICDRYAHSGVAFSSAKVLNNSNDNNDADDDEHQYQAIMSIDWCRSSDVGLPAPDAVIFLDLSLDEAEKRGGYGAERYEKRDLQQRVRQRFADLQQMDDGHIPWHVVDASQSVEVVEAEIWTVVEQTLQDIGSKPLQKLWEPLR